MAIDKLSPFRNINYDYKTDDDVFIGRGLQLNMINDTLSAVIDAVNTDTSYLFGSGLTPTAGLDFVSVVLGGALTGPTTLSMDNTANLLITGDRPAVGSMYSQFTYNNLVFSVSPTSPYAGSNARSELILSGTTAGLRWYNSGYQESGISFTAGVIQIVDVINSKGAVYTANYDAAGILDDDWIPSYRATKAYADTLLPSYGTTTQIPYMNGAGTDFIYSSSLTFSGVILKTNSVQLQAGVAVDNIETVLTDDDTNIPTSGAVWDAIGGGMVYPGAGIALSTGAAWGTSITNNSANWNTAYTHSQVVTGNPHSVVANDVLPSQSGHGGEFLITDGSNVSWAAGGGGGGTVTLVTSTTTNQLTVATGATTPALTIVTGAVVNAGTALATGDQIYDFVIGLGYSTTVGTVTSVSGTGTENGLTLTGTVSSSGNLTLGGTLSINNSDWSGTVLSVPNGGTGLSTVGTNRVLTGAGGLALVAEANMTFTGTLLAVTGAITATGEITAYSSDRRLKTNIVRIPDPLEKVAQLDGVTYDWNMDVCNKVGFKPARRHETGMIAQNLGSVISDAITFAPFDRNRRGFSKSGKDYLTVNLEKVIPLLVEAVKELTERNEELVERVRELENN